MQVAGLTAGAVCTLPLRASVLLRSHRQRASVKLRQAVLQFGERQRTTGVAPYQVLLREFTIHAATHPGSVLDKRTEFRLLQNWSFVARSGR